MAAWPGPGTVWGCSCMSGGTGSGHQGVFLYYAWSPLTGERPGLLSPACMPWPTASPTLEPAVVWPPGRWQMLEDLEKGLKLTPTPSVGAQVPDTREQGEREDCGYLFQQHLAVRPQQAQTLLVSNGTFVLSVARWRWVLPKPKFAKDNWWIRTLIKKEKQAREG